MVFIDPKFPEVLGAELYRPKPEYIAKYVTRPRVKYEFLKGPGDTVQLDRYNFWADQPGNVEGSLTKDSRERSDVQVIGVNNARTLSKDKIILLLKEYSGPADPTDPNAPSTFRIPLKTVLTAQRMLWQYGQKAFHDSIGSTNLLDDYRRWEDRVYINELLKSTFTYNPGGVADGGSYNLALNNYGGLPPKFRVEDADQIVADMTARNCPRFEDGNYACICSPHFLNHLRRDPEFREVARYPGAVPLAQLTAGGTPMAPPQIPFVNGAMPGNFNTPFQGGLMAGQSYNANGNTMMPTGFVFNGVRYFVSSNMPKASVTLSYSNQGAGITGGSATRTAEIGIFFGPEAIAMGMGGPGPEILLNSNDDFQRFIIAIWRTYSAWELADGRFVTTARSYTT